MKPYRLAIIGAGHLGRIHARQAKNVPGLQLVGVCDPLEANRRAVAAEQDTAAFADHRELFGCIDAAVLATPTEHHHAVGMELLQQGIHLLIEKPLATTLAQADDLVRAARASGAVLQVGHIERFNPVLSAALPHLREPKYIEASRLSGFTGRSTDIGAVLDIMIHDIDLVLWLARSPLRHVDALGVSVMGGHEDAANARLVFENGCVATLNASRISYQVARTMHVWTADGFASLDFATRTATLVRPAEAIARRTFQVSNLPPEDRAVLKDKLFEQHLPKRQLQSEPIDAITAELADFADSLHSGRAPRVSGEQGRDALAVAEQVLSKIRTHLWDGHVGGRTGPHALPTPSVIPAPHWDRLPRSVPLPQRREAG